MAGPTSPIYFPVPWAREPSISHLQPPGTIRSLIAATGFNELAWVDETASATAWFHQRLSATASEGPPPLGLHLLLGPDFGEMFRNQVLNLSEGRISVIQAVFERPWLSLLLRIILNKSRILAPKMLQALLWRALMTTARSGWSSDYCSNQKRA
jgi:hypothetical protein